jgi:hypothetical protein
LFLYFLYVYCFCVLSLCWLYIRPLCC